MKPWWARFASYARLEVVGLAALVGLAAIGVALDVLLPWPLKLIVDHVLTGAPLPATVAWMIPPSVAESAEALLAILVLALMVLFLLVQAVQLLKSYVQAGITARMQYALGADVFGRLQDLSLTYHVRARKGDLTRRVISDTDCAPTLITGVLLPLIVSILTLVVLFAIMWQLDPLLALIASLVCLPMAGFMRLLGHRMAERAYEHQEAEGEVWSVAEQSLTAIPIVQAFGREEHEHMRFRGVAGRSIRTYLRTIVTQLQFKVGVEGSEALGLAAIMVVGGMHVGDGTISVGTLILFLSYLAALYAPLNGLAYLSSTLAAATGSGRRVAEVLDATEMVQEQPGAPPLPRLAARTGSGIRFENVTFGYTTGRPVLHGINLELGAGQTTALVGPTGAGKTTLVSLIPRLFDPWEGRILIDGQDLRTANLHSVRSHVALVLQDPFLLPVSIAENIAYARPSATKHEILAAAEAANAHEFIETLPQGYDTIIGERGITLSGGQRQRLSIARAILKDASVLILDEPTSALDAGSEDAVMRALERLMLGRTSLIIAHRLSTIRRADCVVVLDRGRIAEMGSHQMLLRARGLYHRMRLAQYQKDEDTTGAGTGLS